VEIAHYYLFYQESIFTFWENNVENAQEKTRMATGKMEEKAPIFRVKEWGAALNIIF
jgi:hypothetical protein